LRYVENQHVFYIVQQLEEHKIVTRILMIYATFWTMW